MNEIILYSFGCLISLISVIAVCVCGCKKGPPKNDLLGLHGMVKITNPDENVNHLPAAGIYVSQNAAVTYVSEYDEQSKRPSGGSNPHRSLPDIPVLASDNGVSGDTSSELYATVDDKTVLAYNKRHTLPNGVEAGPSLSHQSSISQSDSNYARLKENPYDKVKKSENPYANVKSDSKENDESSREPSPQASWNNIVRVSDSVENVSVDQTILERRRASGQGSQNGINSSSPVPDIPAATAVAGRVAASQELPYMTPPITQPQHFSGDSQDSSRGYTSISVREPLANILSQTPAIRSRRTDLDPHYSTVSDDSDEMYAAIVEPNSNIYNGSGSETYAQIQPITVAEIHGHTANNETLEEDDQYEPAPQPPSVDSLKHVAHVHSRQASSSSCTSSVANLGSPKPEKRQANSPLPPPPPISPDLYSRIDKNGDDVFNVSVARNLEDMYAKVHKNKKKIDEIGPSISEPSTSKTETTIPFVKRDSYEDFKNLDAVSIKSDTENSPNSKSVGKRTSHEHCYETLNKDKNSPKNWQGTTQCTGPESLLSNDPGYEQLNPQNRASSESDPNYEVLRPQRTPSVSESVGYSTIGKCNKSTLTVNPNYVPENNASCVLTPDGYSVVNKNKISNADPGYEELNNKIIDEPNYESMPSECCQDDNYATINKSNESGSDPNYECVKYLDVTLSEPPYEKLQNDENAKDSSDHSEYEQISGNKSSTPDYERIKDNSKSSENSEDCSNVPDYERIKDSSKSSDNSLDHSDDKSATPDYKFLKNSDNSSDSSKLSSNNVEILVEQASIILTVTSDVTEVKINIPNAPKEIVETNDIFHV